MESQENAERITDRLWKRIYRTIDESELIQCVKSGMVKVIPALLIGSFALMFSSLPISAYQDFINGFMSGIIVDFLNIIHSATFNLISVYLTISLAVSYSSLEKAKEIRSYTIVFTALACFFMFTGIIDFENYNADNLGAQGMFTSLVCTLLSCGLYCRLARKIKNNRKCLAEGVDENFQNMYNSIEYTLIVIVVFAVLYTLMTVIFDVRSLLELTTNAFGFIFENMSATFGTSALLMIVESVLWFMGMHGGNILEPVAQEIFVPVLENNQNMLAMGGTPDGIYSKTFLDVFVLMGGCGSAMCLFFAVLIFGKNRTNKKLAKIAAFPLCFNISELLVFGLPVVYNFMLLIPFLLTPIVMLVTSALAMKLGIVPIAISQVKWTTPVIIGGYVATGSVAGALLQVFNLIIGTLIYAPFVIMADRRSSEKADRRMKKLVDVLKQSEELRKDIVLTKLRDESGIVARTLADELADRVAGGMPALYYQPQYNSRGECTGAEALLRWNHVTYGFIYPPLVFKLAQENGTLLKLEEKVFTVVVNDMDTLVGIVGDDAEISVNVTGDIIQMQEYEEFLLDMKKRFPRQCSHILIEITEQAAIDINDELIARITRLKNEGFRFGIDDFSMGNTSIKYLQHNLFDLIKLDGALVKDIETNRRSHEIVSSIVKLAGEIGLDVLAEYVESEGQRDMLEGVGCYRYQGYLFSKAVSIQEFREVIQEIAERD